MKDKENQVFDEYGNYDFPTEIKQERLNNATSQSEKIVYGSLITSTKCYNCIHFPLCFAQKGGANLELASENDCCYYLSKLPEDSVVLSKEEYNTLKAENDKYVKDCIDYIATINKLENKVWEVEQQASKETAEKIFKMLISELDSNQFLYGKRIIMEVDVENLAKKIRG